MSYIGEDDCPPPPPVNGDVRAAIVHEACETIGGLAKLADALEAAPESVARWVQGHEPPPEHVYRRCIEIVLLHDRDGA